MSNRITDLIKKFNRRSSRSSLFEVIWPLELSDMTSRGCQLDAVDVTISNRKDARRCRVVTKPI